MIPIAPLGESLAQAMQYHQEGRFAEAELAYRALLDEDSDQSAVPPLLGGLLLRAGRITEALPLLARAAALHPDDSDAHLAHANALYRAGQSDEAIRAYRLLLERWPGKSGAWSNLAEALRAHGHFDQALEAADRALSQTPHLAEAHLGRGNALLALGRAAEAEDAYRKALADNPDLAAAAASQGAALAQLGRYADAEASARHALQLAPKLAEAAFVLGCALRHQGKTADATASLESATQLDPTHARAWLNLGNLLAEAGRAPEAETAYRSALAADPVFPEAHSGLGCVLSQSGRLDEALASFDRAISLRPNFAEAHWNQGFTLLLAGDLARGWEKYEWRKRHDHFAATFPTLTGQAWEGQPLAGRTLLIYAEQGLGDTVQFARYAPVLAQHGAKVVLACDPKLVPLLASVPGVAAAVAKNEKLPPYDFWVDQMSLPRILETRLENIPSPEAYLSATPSRVEAWRKSLPVGFKVGLVWAGNPHHSNNARRSAPPEALIPLTATAGATFISLQVGGAAIDAGRIGSSVIDVSDRLTDFQETAAAISCLDLIITVDTAVAHLAGALGKPVWTMLPHAPDWRWMCDRTDTPWYNSMRLFRQSSPGDWTELAARMADALKRQI